MMVKVRRQIPNINDWLFLNNIQKHKVEVTGWL